MTTLEFQLADALEAAQARQAMLRREFAQRPNEREALMALAAEQTVRTRFFRMYKVRHFLFRIAPSLATRVAL